MATITRRDGTIEDAGESLSEFKARQQSKRIKKRGLSSSEKASGYTQEQFVNYYDSKTAEASKQRAELKQQLEQQAKINPLEQSQPKGSYKVTQSDGTVVYRTSGQSATGLYVNDIYQEIQKQQTINKQQDTFKYVPKGAYKVKDDDGNIIYRTSKKVNGKTIITDYRRDYTKETKTLETQFKGGSKTFIPKPANPKQFLPDSPSLDFAKSIRATPEQEFKNQASTGLSQYAETLIQREQRLSNLKNKVYDFFHIQPKENVKLSFNPINNLKFGVEIVKGVARVPFEFASLPVFVYGRSNLITRSIFDKKGRQVLGQGFKDTPKAILSAYVSKDTDTGKRYLSGQNVVNIGLTAYGVRSVAKSPVGTKYNPFYRAWEKRQVTNIKGTITGYQGHGAKGPKYFKETVFKSSGKYKGFNYKETTIFKGKNSQTIINYRGKIYNIKRTGTTGTYQIIKPKTNLVLTPKKFPFLRKNLKVIKQGKFTDKTNPIKFKTGKGVTSQDISILADRGISTQYIHYLEKLRTQATAQGTIKAGSQKLKFDAKTNIKVDTRVSGVITKQRIRINRFDFESNKFTLVDKYKAPRVEFVKKPIQQPDVIISRFLKDGRGAIYGKETGVIVQPRSLAIGKQQTVFEGTFTIKSPPVKPIFKNPAILKPYKNLINNAKGIKAYKNLIKNSKGKPINTPSKVTPSKTTPNKPLINTNKITKSPYKSQAVKLGDQIHLTDSIITEQQAQPVFIGSKSQAPNIQYTSANFNLLSKPINNIKPAPLFPTIKPLAPTKSDLVPSITINKKASVNIIKSSQYVKPTNVYSQNSIISQIQNQRPKTNIKIGQSSKFNTAQKPNTEIKSIQEPVQIQSQIQNTAQKQTNTNVFNNIYPKLTTPIFQPPKFTPEIVLPTGFIKPKFNNQQPRVSGFNVFTRIKGKFTRANVKPLSQQDAINFGAYQVGTTSQATFKVVSAGQQAQDVFKGKGILSDFYRKGNLYIEKKERRIKSIGELQEITFKGISSRKTKNIFTRLGK